MENHAGNNVEYWLSVDKNHKDAIYNIRKWTHLKMAIEDHLIWVRGFTDKEINSTTVLKIPFISRYYLKDTHLVPYGKVLPTMIEPSLLWSPITRGLKVTLPRENFNYFGLDQTFQISLVTTNIVKPISATVVEMKGLANYLQTAFKVRTQNLTWTILNDNNALIIGTPILPINGQDFYQSGCFLLPAGWKLEYDNLITTYTNALEDSVEFWYLVDEKSKIFKLKKSDFNQLNKGSFIKTIA